jgi:hypothetical protein
VTPDYADNAATSTDPLMLALCDGAGPPIWVDPMLDELAASLVASWSMGALVLRPSNALPAVQQTNTDERPSLDLYAFEGNGRSARSLSLETTPAATVDTLADTLPIDCNDGGDVDPLAVDGPPMMPFPHRHLKWTLGCSSSTPYGCHCQRP